jgi:hypothetical protein
MRRIWGLCFLLAGGACAQSWEVGAIGGFGFSPTLQVKASAGTADTGFRNGAVVGVFGAEETRGYWAGEARYLYRFSDLKLSQGASDVRFGAHTHIAEGNFLLHFTKQEARVRPFISFGGGVKIIQGTGVESAAQPLGRYAALTATREVLPVAGVGFGFKLNIRKHLRLRIEGRDYISPAPNEVIAPSPGAALGGVLHDFMGLTSVSYTW